MALKYITSKKIFKTGASELVWLRLSEPHNIISLGAPKGHNPSLPILQSNKKVCILGKRTNLLSSTFLCNCYVRLHLKFSKIN